MTGGGTRYNRFTGLKETCEMQKERFYIMRIIIDTEKERIILPKNFFAQLDKMNKVLADGGSDKKWTAETYVREQFEKVIKNTMLRPEDKVVR